MANLLQGYLLIADITGYTMYLSQSELDHAQQILTVLLELLVTQTRPPLVLSRLAGDAVISYGIEGSFLQGQTFIELMENTYVAFRRAIEQMVMNTTCRCRACANISSLDLKFFVHYGAFAIQRIVDHDELVGSDVNLLHRLLKNHVTQQLGLSAYILYTDQAVHHLGMDEMRAAMIPLVEQYEHLGQAQVWVQDIHPVWEQKRHDSHISIPSEQVLMTLAVEIAQPPELVWDRIADPAYRNLLMGAVRQEVQHRVHGRVVPGSVYQCIHEKGKSVLTVLEWEPFERLVLDSHPPVPQVGLLMDLRLEPSPQGTRLVQVYSRARGPLPFRLLCDFIVRRSRAEFASYLEAFRAAVERNGAGQGLPGDR